MDRISFALLGVLYTACVAMFAFMAWLNLEMFLFVLGTFAAIGAVYGFWYGVACLVERRTA